MKILLFCLIAYCITLASAYAETGAYERLLYYYLYLIDADRSPDQMPTKVAPGCAKKPPKCNFNDFIKFINEIKDDDFKTPITSDPVKEMDLTAKALKDAGLTGTYKSRRIWKGLKRDDDIGALFQNVGSYLASNGAKVSNEEMKKVVDQAQLALKRVKAWRGFESHSAMQRKIQAVLGPEETVELMKMPLSDTESRDVIDYEKTLQKYPEKRAAIEQAKAESEDPNHLGYHRAAANAVALVCKE